MQLYKENAAAQRTTGTTVLELSRDREELEVWSNTSRFQRLRLRAPRRLPCNEVPEQVWIQLLLSNYWEDPHVPQRTTGALLRLSVDTDFPKEDSAQLACW
jgi:hypothetical protein